MKKVIVLLIIVLSLSCKKETTNPQPTQPANLGYKESLSNIHLKTYTYYKYYYLDKDNDKQYGNSSFVFNLDTTISESGFTYPINYQLDNSTLKISLPKGMDTIYNSFPSSLVNAFVLKTLKKNGTISISYNETDMTRKINLLDYSNISREYIIETQP